MSTTVIERPASFSFSKNEVRYVLNTTGSISFLQVKVVYKLTGSEQVIDLKTYALNPNPDGKTYIYLSKLLAGLLSFVVPDPAQAVTSAGKQCIQFAIHFRERTPGDNEPAWITTETNHWRWLLQGGVEQQIASRNNIFTALAASKQFLTWLPSGRYVFPMEKLWLTFLNQASLNGISLKLRKKLFNADATDTTTTLTLSAGLLHHIHVSPLFLGLNADIEARNLHWYEVSLVNNDNPAITSSYRFYIEYRPLYNQHFFVYQNSLGGIDTVAVAGQVELTQKRSVEEIETGLDLNDWQSTVKRGEKSHLAIRSERTYKGDIGFLRTRRHAEAMQDLLLSKCIFERMFDRWVPILNIQSSGTMPSTEETLYNMPIEWQLPFSNEVYTPDDIELNKGIDTEIYE